MLLLNIKDAYCKMIILIIFLSNIYQIFFFAIQTISLRDLNSNMKETGDIARVYQEYIRLTGSILGGGVKIWYNNKNVRHDFQF